MQAVAVRKDEWQVHLDFPATGSASAGTALLREEDAVRRGLAYVYAGSLMTTGCWSNAALLWEGVVGLLLSHGSLTVRVQKDWAQFVYRTFPFPSPSGSRLVISPCEGIGNDKGATARTPADMVAAVKAAFGLSVSQFARIMGVQRPTVYAWLDEEGGPEALRAANRDRLLQLTALAEEWNRRSSASARGVLERHVIDGKTLLEWLAQEPVNIDAARRAIASAAQALKREREGRKPSLAERLKAKRFPEVPSSRRGPVEN